MDYKDIERVNGEIKPTKIKENEYAQVSERIKAFRKLYPQGSIVTEIKLNDGNVCVFSASAVYEDENGVHVLGTGHACEEKGNGFINKTSYIENCETSAVGRALGMAGFGIDLGVSSAEEVDLATRLQDEATDELEKIGNRNITEKEATLLQTYAKKVGVSGKEMLAELGVERMSEVTIEQYANFIKKHENDNSKEKVLEV